MGFKDDKYNRKRKMHAFVIEIFDGHITNVYQVKRPRHLASDVMIVNLDAKVQGRDIKAEPVEVLPMWQANEETKKAIDKLQNVLPDPTRQSRE